MEYKKLYIYAEENGFTKIREITIDENGEIKSSLTKGAIMPNEEPVKIIEGEENIKKYYWCEKWKELKEKDQMVIISVFGESNLKALLKTGLMALKYPKELYDSAINHYHKKGFNKPCTRCGGSGNYSYNPMYGRTCFKCNGRKIQSVVPSKKQIEKVIEKCPNGLKNTSDYVIKGKGKIY